MKTQTYLVTLEVPNNHHEVEIVKMITDAMIEAIIEYRVNQPDAFPLRLDSVRKS